MSSVRMTVGQAVVRFLAQQLVERDGIERRLVAGVWGIFGHGNVAGLGAALEEFSTEVGLPFYRAQNEQAMVHAAAAYARHLDRLSTFACTTSIGPGATNMITAAAGATINRLPVLLLPGDVFAGRRPDPVLQQLEHPLERDLSVNDAFRPVSRFFDRIMRPEQVLTSLPEAMRVLSDPLETGAVTVCLPQDVQAEALDVPAWFLEPRVWRLRRPLPEPEALRAAADALARARRPIIVAGGGAIYAGATAELRALAEALGAPVVETQAGKGALPWDHPLCAGPIGAAGGLAANRLARDADLVLAVGTRLADFTTASRTAWSPAATLIGLNLVPMDAYKHGALPLVADARRGLAALLEALATRGHEGAPAAYRDEVTRLKSEWDGIVTRLRTPAPGEPLSQANVIGIVNDAVGGRATMVCAAGSMPGDLLKLWRPEDEKAYHVEYGFSCMGYEIAAGLGVRLADPEREVVVMVGDGSYLMMNSEIVTAIAEGLRFTVVLVDNGGFQSIHGLQRSVGVPSFGNELRARDPKSGRLDGPRVPVDFVRHAEAMGALALQATDAASLRAALEWARAADRVTVIVVPLDPDPRVPGFEGWWDVPVAAVSGRDGVRAARDAYETAVARRDGRPGGTR